MRRYWLVVERYENWLTDKQDGFKRLGFRDRYLATIKKMQKGDRIVIYVTKKSSFAGVYEVVSPTFYRDTTLVWDDIFPLRIEVRPEIVLNEDAFVLAKDIVNDLSFTRGRGERWGKYFQNPRKELKEEDYRKLYESIRQAAKKA